MAYFRGLKSSLLPGGRVAIVDFKKESPEGPPPEFRFTPEQIAGEMKQAGFVVDGRHDFLPRQLFVVFKPGIAQACNQARRRRSADRTRPFESGKGMGVRLPLPVPIISQLGPASW